MRLHEPDWSPDSHALALTVRSVIGTRMVHALLNSWKYPLDFELPTVASTTMPWRRIVDTALDPPEDISDLENGPPLPGLTYRADAHSVVLLCADLPNAIHANDTTPESRQP